MPWQKNEWYTIDFGRETGKVRPVFLCCCAFPLFGGKEINFFAIGYMPLLLHLLDWKMKRATRSQYLWSFFLLLYIELISPNQSVLFSLYLMIFTHMVAVFWVHFCHFSLSFGTINSANDDDYIIHPFCCRHHYLSPFSRHHFFPLTVLFCSEFRLFKCFAFSSARTHSQCLKLRANVSAVSPFRFLAE